MDLAELMEFLPITKFSEFDSGYIRLSPFNYCGIELRRIQSIASFSILDRAADNFKALLPLRQHLLYPYMLRVHGLFQHITIVEEMRINQSDQTQ